jgi:hypothetical protein
MAGERRNGSTAIGLVAGAVLLVAGVMSFMHHDVIGVIGRDNLNGGACLLFAVILIWWAISPPGAGNPPLGKHRRKFLVFVEGRNWGIGFETITMIVGVMTAAVAILTLTNGK